ncbi:MAG: hypothetical protein QOF51_3708, partial [Chloroflexota bacterium]|nr:hypothetical protein [Chloroflexota bacterium]
MDEGNQAPGAPGPPGAVARRATRKAFALLMLGALVGAVAILPYSLALIPPLPPGGPPLSVLLALSVVQSMVVMGLATAIGLWLGPRVGLGASLLLAWVAGDPQAPRRFRVQLPQAITLGVLAGGAMVALDLMVFAPHLPAGLQTETPGPLLGLLASLYGALDEEILLRLGLMTFLAWLGSVVTRQRPPSTTVLWVANVLAALLFGLGHLPATATILPLTPLVVVRAIVLNGL